MHTKQVLPMLILVVGTAAACAGKPANSPTTAPPNGSQLPPSTVPSTVTVTADQSSYPGCYYVWATQELPDLSEQVNEALQTVDSAVTGGAYAFGEDCVAPDGARTFLAMETDFRARVGVENLKDEETLGNWIAEIMRVIQSLPQDGIPGTHPGRVEFEFYKSETESLRLTVDITRYLSESKGMSGKSLFQQFVTPQ